MNKPVKIAGRHTVEEVLDEITARTQKAEAWRPALIAFYERDEMPTKAKFLKGGGALDYLDLRAIDALEAAFIHAAIAA